MMIINNITNVNLKMKSKKKKTLKIISKRVI